MKILEKKDYIKIMLIIALSIIFSISQIIIMIILEYLLSIIHLDKEMDSQVWSLLIVILLGSLSKYLFKLLSHYLGSKITLLFRERMIREIFQCDFLILEHNPSDRILNGIGVDATNMQQSLEYIFSEAVSQPVIFAAAFIFLAIKNPMLLLISSFIIPVILIGIGLLMRPLTKISNNLGSVQSGFIEIVNEEKDNIFNIKIYQLERWYQKKIDWLINKYIKEKNRLDWYANVSLTVGKTAECLPIFICLIGGAALSGRGLIKYEEFIIFLYGLQFFLDPILHFPETLKNIKVFKVSKKRICQILEKPSYGYDVFEEEVRDKAIIHSGLKEMSVVLEHISFRALDNSEIVSDISLSIKQGERVFIKGANGSGKTTILKLLTGLYQTNKGKIIIMGHVMAQDNIKKIREYISYVSQDAALFPMSFFENISMYTNASIKQVEEVAKICGIHDYINSLPEKYNSRYEIGRNGLSGGQKQRIAMARALLKKPCILILDESLSQVDMESGMNILLRVTEFLKKSTILMISHNNEHQKFFNRIITIEKGRLVQEKAKEN